LNDKITCTVRESNRKIVFVRQDDDEMRNSDHTEDEDSTLVNQRIKLKEIAYFVLGKAWPDDVQTQSK